MTQSFSLALSFIYSVWKIYTASNFPFPLTPSPPYQYKAQPQPMRNSHAPIEAKFRRVLTRLKFYGEIDGF